MLRVLEPKRAGSAIQNVRLLLAATALAVILAWLAAGPASADTASHSPGMPSAALSGPRVVVLQLGAGYGASGSRPVRELQRLLATAGYSPGRADGRFGTMTQTAVERYQADHGLIVDGIAGPRTLAALAGRGKLLSPGAGFAFGSSPAVRHLQLRLARAGYSPGPVDGLFGTRTEAAVRRFQAHTQLPVTGVVAASTLAALRSSSSRRVPAASPPSQPGQAHHASRPTARSAPPTSAIAKRAPGAGARRAPLARPGHPTSGTPAAWPWLLALVVIGLLVSAPLYLHRRRRGPTVVSQPSHGAKTGDITAVSPEGAGVLSPEDAVTSGSAPAPIRPRNPIDDEREALSAADLFERGVLLQADRDLRGAEAAYRSADEQGHAAAASNLGVLLEQRGDLQGAEGAYHRADQRGEANGAFNLGVLLEEREDLAAAESAYRRADKRGHPAAASNLGVLLEGRDDAEGAEAAYRRAAERGEPNGAFNLGVLLEEHGDFAAAEAAYRQAESGSDARVSRLARGALLDLIPGIADAGAAPAGGETDGA